jgi:hypothetical protein
MFGDVHRHRRDVEDLPADDPADRRSGQATRTAPAAFRFVADDLVGVGHSVQRLTVMARLTAGFPTSPPPQGFRRWFRQTITRRRFRGVLRVLIQPASQLSDFRLQLFDLRRLLGDYLPLSSDQSYKFVVGRLRHTPIIDQSGTIT